MSSSSAPELTGIVVHWYDEEHLHELVAAWNATTDLPLLVIDNGSTGALPTGCQILSGQGNLGFAGAVNLGLRHTESPQLLVMNSDVRPRPRAVEALLAGARRWPDAAALAPRLVDDAGDSQYRWQCRSLPTVGTLLLQALLLPVTGGRRHEPGAGERIEQPAAAALLLRRRELSELDGFDEDFYPAWFEDVDLARRMHDRGMTMRYCPTAELVHRLGSSVPHLGYGRFLTAYYTNLCRYLAKHHGRLWSSIARLLLVPAALLRLLLVPLRRPRRAASRRRAAAGLWSLATAATRGWPEVGADTRPGSPDTSPSRADR